MAKVVPFKAVRTSREKVSLVASKSYEAYSPAELGAILDFNPMSFLHIINPGYKYQQEITGKERFRLVHNRYEEFKENNILQKDENPNFYIYRKLNKDNVFCGILAGVSVEDYENNTIKKHENTLEKRICLFKDYLKTCGFNAEPVLLTYPDNIGLQEITEQYTAKSATYAFATNDGCEHHLWNVSSDKDIKAIKDYFETIDALYIADGHHRSASSHALAKEYKNNNATHTEKEAYNYFMSYLIPESHLQISEFNRLIKDLNGLSKEEFLLKLDASFRITNKGQSFYKPSKKHHFSMYLDGEFYSLYLRKDLLKNRDSLDDLDTQILHTTILAPILGMEDIRNNDRIAYLHGKNEDFRLKNEVDQGNFAVAFGLYPTSVSQLKKIADNNQVMPPKSTYIEPKLLSGLTIYEFE